MKPKVFSSYGQKLDFELNSPVEIYIDCAPPERTPSSADITRVLIVMEPDGILGMSNVVSRLYKTWHMDHVLTYDVKILENCPVASLFEFGTSWIEPDESTDKKYCVSNVCGKKGVTDNRLIREQVFSMKDMIKIPTDFYVSGNENMVGEKVLGPKKDPLFESMFHICIENYSLDYYFSEKLVDSLIRKTVPIYIGCNKIEKYFNIDGILRASSASEVISLCNVLTVNDYYNRMDAIEENFEKAKYWKDWTARLKEKLLELGL